jgi:hypothetical protein
MKSVFALTAAFLLAGAPAFAQSTPSDNAAIQGGETTPGNGAGMPSSATPMGKISTVGGDATTTIAPAVPALSGSPTAQAMHPTADSSTTGTTSAPAK